MNFFTDDLLFLGFSVNLILSCILTITAFNAVGALMALIFAFINATCIFFLMELEFIGLLFLIVYVGAISVLFLFAVMLFNLKDVVRVKTTTFVLTNLFIFIGIAVLFLSLFQLSAQYGFLI
jgi:NADH:ubiquinone oxidoreductase subunit 6 (subunit J)